MVLRTHAQRFTETHGYKVLQENTGAKLAKGRGTWTKQRTVNADSKALALCFQPQGQYLIPTVTNCGSIVKGEMTT